MITNKKVFFQILILLLFLSTAMPTFAASVAPVVKKATTSKPLEKLFYYVPGFSTFYSLQANGNKANIFAPQVYKVDADGVLTGSISDIALEVVNKNKTPIMPLVSNEDFDPDTMHTILQSTDLQNKIIK